jgi:hypothetical protein
MSLGNLQNEADLKRFLEQQARTPGVLPATSMPFKGFKFGAATVEWGGVSADSEPLVVEHGMGEEPVAVLFGAAFPNIISAADPGDFTNTDFTLVVRDTDGAPEEGAEALVFWLAVA